MMRSIFRATCFFAPAFQRPILTSSGLFHIPAYWHHTAKNSSCTVTQTSCTFSKLPETDNSHGKPPNFFYGTKTALIGCFIISYVSDDHKSSREVQDFEESFYPAYMPCLPFADLYAWPPAFSPVIPPYPAGSLDCRPQPDPNSSPASRSCSCKTANRNHLLPKGYSSFQADWHVTIFLINRGSCCCQKINRIQRQPFRIHRGCRTANDNSSVKNSRKIQAITGIRLEEPPQQHPHATHKFLPLRRSNSFSEQRRPF